MTNVSTIANSLSAYQTASTGNTSKSNNKTETSSAKSAKTAYAPAVVKKDSTYGKTVGSPELSEKAAKYYESLKKKFSNMDFVLVSADQKENAQSHASSYANANKMVVLIDEEKLEKMAEDENFRKKYEGIIAQASSGISSLKSQLEASGANVQGYGMQVDDNGTASYFAVLKKSSADQKARIEKGAEKKKAEKKAAKKAAEKKAEKKAEEKRIEEKNIAEKHKVDKHSNTNSVDKTGKTHSSDKAQDTVVIKANSIEELMSKIESYTFSERSDNIQTESEKYVGANFDFRG